MDLETAKVEQSKADQPAYIFYDTIKESYFIANIDCRNEHIKLAMFDKNGIIKLI